MKPVCVPQIAQTNEGKIIITPGTIVHMECLWKRRFGSPEWTIDNYSGRTYPQVRARANTLSCTTVNAA